MSVCPLRMFDEYVPRCLDCVPAVTGLIGYIDFNVMIMEHLFGGRVVDPFTRAFAQADTEGEEAEHFD